jgi:hypothetical protein
MVSALSNHGHEWLRKWAEIGATLLLAWTALAQSPSAVDATVRLSAERSEGVLVRAASDFAGTYQIERSFDLAHWENLTNFSIQCKTLISADAARREFFRCKRPGFAPYGLNGKFLTFGEGTNALSISFSKTANSFTNFVAGSDKPIDLGSFAYRHTGENSGTVTLSVTKEGLVERFEYDLRFMSARSGAYVLRRPDGGTDNGNFSGLVDRPPWSLPNSLRGAVMDLTLLAQGNERLSFMAAPPFGAESDVQEPRYRRGAYIYTPLPDGSTAILTVVFGNADQYALVMRFDTDHSGLLFGEQHYDGSDHAVPNGSLFSIVLDALVR